MDEQAFRALLDARGVLRAGAEVALVPAFHVFAQRPDAFVDAAAWGRQATQFFGCRVGLTTDKTYEGSIPTRDAVRVVLVGADGSSSTHLCLARPRTEAMLVAAREAEARARMPGLAKLAERCPIVWTLDDGGSPAHALRLAGVLAGALLGPILTPDASDIFGVRTVMHRLARS